ncbi:MAG: type II secretion system protein [Puniceicoccales bacterium]
MRTVQHQSASTGTTRAGFSLIEMLVVISVLAILGTLIFTVTQKAYISSQKTMALSGLREVATAIQLYSQDNNGYLPGPLWSTTNGYYGNDDRALGYHLYSYLGLPEPETGKSYQIPQLTCPLFEEMRIANGTPCYFITQRVKIGSANRNPWGYRSTTQEVGEGTLPQKFGTVLLSNEAADTTAMYAADAANVTNPDAGWASNLIPEPLFGTERLHLYFDWHVDFVPITED